MIDMVPKAISYTLVNFAKENLQQTLLEELYRQDLLDDLLRESPDVTARRKEWVAAVNFADAQGRQDGQGARDVGGDSCGRLRRRIMAATVIEVFCHVRYPHPGSPSSWGRMHRVREWKGECGCTVDGGEVGQTICALCPKRGATTADTRREYEQYCQILI